MDSSGTPEIAARLREAWLAALGALDLPARTERAIGADVVGPVTVLAIGKSATPMLEGALRALGSRVARVVVARPTRSVPLTSQAESALARRAAFTSFVCGHPIPDRASFAAGSALLDAARETASGTLLVLLSGGASACACVPVDGVSREDVVGLAALSLAWGAPIDVVNAMRGRIDAFKHGGLLRATNAPHVRTLVSVDVLGPLDLAVTAVGSGPTAAVSSAPLAPDLLSRVPERLRSFLAADAPPAPAHPDARTIAVASPDDLFSAMARALATRGWNVERAPDAFEPVDAVAARYARSAKEIAPGDALVAVGEPTVALRATGGRGGRAGRLALEVATRIDGTNAFFLAAASDGVDGESGHAGAIVSGETMKRARERSVDVDAALLRDDDAIAHEALGTTLDTGPTGINLVDVHALARPR